MTGNKNFVKFDDNFSSSVKFGDDKAITVFALSAADTPVEVLTFASYTNKKNTKIITFKCL